MVDEATETRASGDGLERLLEVEARIDERLAECRSEADEVVRAVRDELAERERRLEAELLAERERRLAARAEELAATIRGERDRTARRARLLRGISAERVEALARGVTGRLSSGAVDSGKTESAG